MNKTFSLGDLFTEEDIKKCAKLKKAALIKDQVVIHKMDHINQVTGQENDPMFISYLLEHVVSSAPESSSRQ